MTAKKYVLTIIAFAAMCLSSLALFIVGYELSPHTHIFYLFSALCFLSSIVVIVCNHKKLVVYEINKLDEKIKSADFSVIEMAVDESKLREKLNRHGYQEITENMFHKKVEDTDGPSDHYYAALFRADEITDVRGFAEAFDNDRKTLACNIGYIFLKKNTDVSLSILKEYVKEILIETAAHPYKRRKSFAPIVIADEKIFYFKFGSFLNEYRRSLSAGLRVLQKNK